MSAPAPRPTSVTDPSPRGETARLAAVRRYEILDEPPDGTFDDIAELAAVVFGAPIATVSVVDADRVFLAACHGLTGVRQVGTEPGLCTSAILTNGPYVVTDAEVDPRTMDHPLVRGQLGIRFYVAAPIVTADGHRLGTVNVMDYQPRQVTEPQTGVLTKLADLVARHLELRLAAIRTVSEERQLRDDADERAAAANRLADKLRAAAAAHANRPHPADCQLGGAMSCSQPAELKIADAWGDSAWGCMPHVEDTILHVTSVFIADENLGGLDAHLNRGRAPGQ